MVFMTINECMIIIAPVKILAQRSLDNHIQWRGESEAAGGQPY